MSSANHARTPHPRTNGSGGNGKEPRDARRRRELIEATISSIAEYGLSGTTVARVAEIAGLSAGIVGFYFQNKDTLLLATLEHVVAEYEEREREALESAGNDPESQLEAIIETNFAPDVCDLAHVAVWNAFWGEARAREDYHRVCGARDVIKQNRIGELFEEITRKGAYDHLDPRALGNAFERLLSSLPEDMLDRHKAFDFDAAKATCRSYLSSIFPVEFPPGGKSNVHRVLRSSGAVTAKAIDREAKLEFETLPTWVYHDPEFFELEKKYILQCGWLFVGHISQVPETGDYVTLDVCDERVLVIRGKDQKLRAFHNTCRHRAGRVVRGETGRCSGVMVCPYHGWTYGFDGKLHAIPAEKTFRSLDKSKLGLPEVELEEWMGFIFVRLSGAGASVAEMLREYDQEARHFRFEDMKSWGKPYSGTYDFNWKLFVENDSEGYHIPTGHPGLRRLFGTSYHDDETTSDASRSFSVLQDKESPVWTERMYQRLLPEVGHLSSEYRRAWAYYSVLPFAAFQISPDMVSCYQVLPVSPSRSRIMGMNFAHEDERREMRAARYLNQRITRQVTQEDLDYCRWVDRGVRSEGYEGGVLSRLEMGVRKFQDFIRERVPVARRREAPKRGQMAAMNEEMRSDG